MDFHLFVDFLWALPGLFRPFMENDPVAFTIVLLLCSQFSMRRRLQVEESTVCCTSAKDSLAEPGHLRRASESWVNCPTRRIVRFRMGCT